MDKHEGLAQRFEAQRGRLRGVAYRMLGSLGEAEDAVQEAWLRLGRADSGSIDNLEGWLTTVVARVCLDMLRSRKSRGEQPLDDQAPGAGTRPTPSRRRSSPTRSASPSWWWPTRSSTPSASRS